MKDREKIFTHELEVFRNEIESAIQFFILNKLYHLLWQLYHNGNKPVLRQMKYSTKRMIRTELPKWQNQHVQERIVTDTVSFLKMLSKIPKEQLSRD
jgi:hypothetical protein